MYSLGKAADYAGERTQVVTGSAAGYNALENDIGKAITADQVAFRSAAAQGSGALDPLEAVVIAASLLMALGCLGGFRGRLAEYR